MKYQAVGRRPHNYKIWGGGISAAKKLMLFLDLV
jgi:hypothetical protein